MVTFIEAPLFSKHVHDYLSDEEYADFQLYLAGNPDSGDIVQGSGGVFARFAGNAEGTGRAAVSGSYILSGLQPAKSGYC